MKQALAIAWKDTLQRLRDPMALILSIAGPLVLVLIFGMVFGGGGGIEPVPAYVVNRDTDQLGQIYADALTSARAAEYVAATPTDDEAAARAAVDRGEAAVAVIVPEGFTDAIFRGEPQQVEVYADPGATLGPAIVGSIVQSVSDSIDRSAATVETALGQLVESGRITPAQQAQVGPEIGERLTAPENRGGIALTSEAEAATVPAGALGYLAPSMLVFFLMLNAIRSGPHILEEQEEHTLTRLFAAPASRLAVIGGKLLGDLLLATVEAIILVAGLRLLFGIDLGDPFGVALLLVGLTLSVTALGILVAGLVPNPTAVSGATQALALLFGLLGGSFFRSDVAALQAVANVTPNHWALAGLLRLSSGGGLADIGLPLAVLFAMALAFAVAGAGLLGRRLAEVSG